MRHALIALALFGCSAEYDLTDHCTSVDIDDRMFAVCGHPVTHDEAVSGCDSLGGTLSGAPRSRVEGSRQGGLIDGVGGVAWIGWPDEYVCPAGDHLGSSGPSDCTTELPYICELTGDTNEQP